MIDIRALASATVDRRSSVAADELLSIESSALPNLGAPMLLPVREKRTAGFLGPLLAGSVLASVAVAAATVIAVLSSGGDPTMQSTDTSARQDLAQTAATPRLDPGEAAVVTDDGPNAQALDEDRPGESAIVGSESPGSRTELVRAGDRERSERTHTVRPREERHSDDRPPVDGTHQSIRELMASTVNQSSEVEHEREPRPPTPPIRDLPDTPSRSDVMMALRRIEGRVRACGNGQHGVASVAVTVAGSTGRVRGADVGGVFSGTPVGSCVSRAVRGAHFPRFSRATFSISYPFRV